MKVPYLDSDTQAQTTAEINHLQSFLTDTTHIIHKEFARRLQLTAQAHNRLQNTVSQLQREMLLLRAELHDKTQELTTAEARLQSQESAKSEVSGPGVCMMCFPVDWSRRQFQGLWTLYGHTHQCFDWDAVNTTQLSNTFDADQQAHTS